jgi:two-component system sensor histidine kinase UhpB
VPVILAQCDAQRRYRYVNRAYAELLALDAAQIVGRTVDEVMGAAAYVKIQPHVDAVLAGRRAEFELEFAVPNQGTRWIRAVYQPQRNAIGEVVGFVAVLEDVTQRVHAEAELRRSEARFRQLADALPQIIWMTDAAGKLDFHNARWFDYTGLDENTATHENNNRFLHPEDEAKILSSWQTAFETGRPFEQEARIRHGVSGQYRWFLCRAVPVFDDSGHVARWFGTSTDIDDQKQTEQLLRSAEQSLRELNASLEARVIERTVAAEERAQALTVSERELRNQTLVMQSILDSMGDAVMVADKDGRILLANRAARTQYFVDQGRHISSLSEDLSRLYCADGRTPCSLHDLPLVRALRGESCDDVEIVVRPGTNGEQTTVSVTGRPMLADDGGIVGGVIVIRDVTARNQMNERLRESEQRFRQSFESAAIGKAIVSLDGRWLKVNRALCELLGYPEAELRNETFQSITHPDDLAEDLLLVNQLLTGETRSYQLEKRYIHRSGRVINTLLSVSLIRDGNESPLYFISQIHDLTELKRAESERRRAAIRTLFVEQTISAREAEQRRLARDLHDGVGQCLTSLRLGLRAVEEASDLNQARESARELRRIAAAAQEEVRGVTKSLRPSVLDDLGLAPAISRLISDLKLVNALEVDFRAGDVEGRRFADVIETALFRIAQEALTNIVRHASARSATVTLRCIDSKLRLTVADDGVGFDAAAVSPAGRQFGLTGMHERASLLGGDLTITSAPGRGTRIEAVITVVPPAERDLAA